MKPSLRFLALVIFGWAGVRAATLGVIPGAEVFRVDSSYASTSPDLPQIARSEFPPLPPIEDAAFLEVAPGADEYGPGHNSAYPEARPPQPAVATDYGPVSPGRPARLSAALPEPRPAFYSPIPTLDDFPLSRIAATSLPPLPQRAGSPAVRQSIPAGSVRLGLDRVQLTAWALLRGRQGLVSTPSGIATGGTLGGSQAGARLTYNVTRQVAATARMSSAIGQRGGEVAAGVRFQPIASIPVWVNAERRQRVGRYGGGRNAFALFLEGGVYDRTLPLGMRLDGYLQGGFVGISKHDRFIDGAATVTRPIAPRFSGGLGVWGGAQPGVYRIDAGPRLTYRVGTSMRVHLDYRQRLAGNAEPGSGPTLTLAGDF